MFRVSYFFNYNFFCYLLSNRKLLCFYSSFYYSLKSQLLLHDIIRLSFCAFLATLPSTNVHKLLTLLIFIFSEVVCLKYIKIFLFQWFLNFFVIVFSWTLSLNGRFKYIFVSISERLYYIVFQTYILQNSSRGQYAVIQCREI